MDRKVIIGLEAHDGSGKSSTGLLLASLFGGQVFFTTNTMKERRREIYQSEEKTKQEKLNGIHLTYLAERADCKHQTTDSLFVVLDRTWLSHAVEQNVRDRIDDGGEPSFFPRVMPADLESPNLVFQILIPEKERKRRVESRGESLTERDLRLNNDDEYREALEKERHAFGCIPLRLRLRDQATCALRAAQVILGHPGVPPLMVSPNSSLHEF